MSSNDDDDAENVSGGPVLSESSEPALRRACLAHRRQYPIAADLLERNKAMRSEIAVLDTLIGGKYAELAALERDEQTEDGGAGANSEAPADDARLPAHVRRLKEVVRAVVDLDEFAAADGLNDDVVDEYIRHLERNYEQVLIVGPEAVHALCALPKEAVAEWLAGRQAHRFERLLFVLKQEGHYSLVLYNGANASFYHYDAAAKRHAELAEQLILKLRRHLEADQLVEVESAGGAQQAQFGESALFTVDSMMKIILTVEDDAKESVSPVQLLNLPSQPDYLKIIIMSRYIVTKLGQIERTVCGGAGAGAVA